MSQAHDKPAVAKLPSKKATNISLSMDVYRDAKELGINISQLCEQALREEIQSLKERQWNARHAEFIAAYNKVAESDGLALREWAVF